MSIYIIRHKESDNCYIGSCKDLNERIRHHKESCSNENAIGYNLKIYQFVRENDGWDNFDFSEICKCENDKLLEMEQYHMDFIKPSLNCRRAFGFDYERRKIYKKKNDREYLENNREKTNKRHKDYRREKIICDCGKEVTRYARDWAKKTGKHNHRN